ncbi:hypothetical protein BDV12DRAFT_164330 [Aspergillus spectabilis]
MTEEGCTGSNCAYTGPSSGAFAGACTNTAGYLANAEINEIVRESTSSTSKITRATRLSWSRLKFWWDQ